MKSPSPVLSSVRIETLEGRALLSGSMNAVHAAAVPPTPTSVTTLTVSPASAELGSPLKLKVVVKGKHGKPTGSVQILDNGVAIEAAGSEFVLPLKGGKANYVLGVANIALTPGSHSLSAQYLSTGKLPASASAATAATVTQPTYTTLSDGLQTATIKATKGRVAKAGDTARVSYTGYLADSGSIFDYASAHGAGTKPYFDFTVQATPEQVIAGFDEAVAGMHVGETRAVAIPSELAYGATGNSAIPPNSDLVFLIKLLKVK